MTDTDADAAAPRPEAVAAPLPAALAAVLDHLVLAGPDLGAAVAHVARLTGVTAAPGGRHALGTANALIAFTVAGARGTHYLEIIGPDPEGEQPASAIATFGIDTLQAPTLSSYAVHADAAAPEDIAELAARGTEAGLPLGVVAAQSRTKPDGSVLAWSYTAPPSRVSPVVPFLIDWGSTAHPGLSELPTLELVALRGEHPTPERLRAQLDALGVPLDLVPGAVPALVATVRGPLGEAELR
ncbi:VOC family protein [Microterricola pindariensis]|uniref:VOC family protein n=1 Tax=Microterricola pindariensis TaxID=478010 RepID=UPI000CECB414|nr:VOC family protein [Microterricola pindariensis]